MPLVTSNDWDLDKNVVPWLIGEIGRSIDHQMVYLLAICMCVCVCVGVYVVCVCACVCMCVRMNAVVAQLEQTSMRHAVVTELTLDGRRNPFCMYVRP